MPADPPYGTPAPASPDWHHREQQARLQQLRQELLAELRQQRQEAATRETTYQQELAQLRQQVAQAGEAPHNPATQAAEAALQTARAELDARTRELDQRIRQLGQLMGRLQASTPPAPTGAAVPAPTTRPQRLAPVALIGPGRPGSRRALPWWWQLNQAGRWGLLVGGLALAGLGASLAWKLVRPAAPGAELPHAVARRHQPESVPQLDEAAGPATVVVVDSSLAAPTTRPDTARQPAGPPPPATTAEPSAAPPEPVGTTPATGAPAPAPTAAPADTTAGAASPTP